MYSPADFLEAIEKATPESKSRAIYALQEALQKQDKLISACRDLVRVAESERGPVITRIEQALRKYDKI